MRRKNIEHLVLNAKNHEREADIIANAGKKNSIIITTSISGRGVDIKLGGKKKDEISKNLIKNLGGLLVIGTERMESRRVDNQARGRSGRQGDEGVSIFYVSLEDDLMRIFGSESMNTILEKLGLKDGESIDHPWINKALERAQQKVESRNFDIRKTLLKFDNVLNDQRQVIFSQRNNILEKETKVEFIDNFFDEIIYELKNEKKKHLLNPKDDIFLLKLKTTFGKAFNEIEIAKILKCSENEIEEIIKGKFLQKRNERLELLGGEKNQEIEKRIFLQVVDQNWKNHIQYLEQLRQVIGLRSYGNRDPLVEYKKEAFSLFETLLEKIKNETILILINLSVVKPNEEKDTNERKIDPKLIGKKIGRNELCYCGSNKKFKHCCGSL